MGKTLAEKILSARAGKDVAAGDFLVVNVDYAFVQDTTGPLAVRQFEAMELDQVFDPARCILFLDHAAPSPRRELSNEHQVLRRFARRTGAILSEIGRGICHQLMAERYVSPGMVVVGADSHSCTAGALGAFGTGLGSTDLAVAMGLGQVWMRVPETIRLVVGGQFPPGVYPKDLILHIIGALGADGAIYKALEFHGSAIADMAMHDRLTLSNMAVECGAKVGLIPADEMTRLYLVEMERGDDFRDLGPDEDAAYEQTHEFDVSQLAPTIACPHFVDQTKTIDEIGEVKVDQVFLGTCTNGRLGDLQIAAGILAGRSVHPDVRLVVTPASKRVLLGAAADGTLAALLEAGAAITTPGCGACLGLHQGALADGEVCLATQNRNFRGRLGNPEASIYLASPAVAAATAIEGQIADPRKYLT